jgi:PAS domain S-box-containing protein
MNGVPMNDEKPSSTERRLAAIVESSGDAIISKSLDGIVQSWNRGAERLLGYTAEEMIGQPITRLEPQHRRHEMAKILERMRAGERIEHFETERVAKDGQIIDVSITVSPIRDETNRIIGVSKVARDISARKRAEAALRASERHLRALVETQVEMVCRFRLDGTILFVNAAYARAQETTAEELIGTNFWHFIPEAERPSLRHALQSITPDSPVLRIENRLETHRGTLWTLWMNRGIEFDAEGRLLEAQSTGIDITERKLMEQQLQVMDERKNQFLATLGHELRNPLAPLRTGLDLLERMTDDPAVRDLRAMMDRQVRHLTRLVDDVIDISRINRGRVELRRSRVDCNDVVDAAIELSAPLVREHDHVIVHERTPEPVWVHGDFERLTQVVSNLLNNAAKYSAAGGKITVELEARQDEAILTVSDTGLGFAPELADSLFDMFARIPHQRQASADGGLGVGLPLARQLVELHGGKIRAQSAGPGKGSSFEIRLPLPAPGEDALPDRARTPPAAPSV